jgi:ERCC4-related helicase
MAMHPDFFDEFKSKSINLNLEFNQCVSKNFMSASPGSIKNQVKNICTKFIDEMERFYNIEKSIDLVRSLQQEDSKILESRLNEAFRHLNEKLQIIFSFVSKPAADAGGSC